MNFVNYKSDSDESVENPPDNLGQELDDFYSELDREEQVKKVEKPSTQSEPQTVFENLDGLPLNRIIMSVLVSQGIRETIHKSNLELDPENQLQTKFNSWNDLKDQGLVHYN